MINTNEGRDCEESMYASRAALRGAACWIAFVIGCAIALALIVRNIQ